METTNIAQKSRGNASRNAILAFGLVCLFSIIYGEIHASDSGQPAKYVPMYWLLSAYDNDLSRAQELYSGKRVVTRGTISGIDASSEQPSLTLFSESDPSMEFQGYFADGERSTLASLDEGRTVKVECTIDGPSDNLLAHGCAIQADN